MGRIANRRGLAVVVVGAVAFLSSAVPYLLYSRSLSPFSSWSFLNAYDEFSYLLAGDTFASGRLTNPTHVMWRHFETRSVIHEPTYQSIYPPGQGAFLAAGQALTGHPIVGVWICMALACAATCYMLQAWFPPRWAFFGGLVAALHARMALEWGGTYWGGGVAMLGGAMLFGGLRRISIRCRARDAFLLGLGLAVLANSRPFEGLVASVPAMVVLAGLLLFDKRLRARGLRARIVAPIVTVLGVTFAFMAYYDYRVTGSPWTLPYQVYLAAHEEGTFIWQRTTHPEDTAEHGPEGDIHSRGENPPQDEWWVAANYNRLVWSSSFVVASIAKLVALWAFYVGPILTAPLVALPFGLGSRWTWFALGTAGLTTAAVLTTSNALPHYVAPIAPLSFVLVVQGSRSLHVWRRRRRRIGRHWVPIASWLWPLQWLLMVGLFPTIFQPLRWGEPQARLRAQLEGMGGKHLVLVRYGPRHVFYQEWVHNGADIEGATVLWARELSPESNQRLLAHFKDRQVWVVEPDRVPPTLFPYDTGPPSSELR